jgi:hypothetical protein
MIVANVPHLWPLISRAFKLGTFAENTTNPFSTDNRSSFTMQNIRKSKNFNPVGSEERIAGSAQGLTYTENKLGLTGERAFRRRTSLVVDGVTKKSPMQQRDGS